MASIGKAVDGAVNTVVPSALNAGSTAASGAAKGTKMGLTGTAKGASAISGVMGRLMMVFLILVLVPPPFDLGLLAVIFLGMVLSWV